MDAVALLRTQLQAAHEFLEATMADVTPEVAHWHPPGTANPISATYIHIVVAEDMIVNVVLKGGTSLLATTWAGKTGISELMPMPGQEWEHYAEWARRVQLDLPALRQYAQAVYTSSDDYLASLTSENLDRQIDLLVIGVGEATLGWALGRLIVGHVDNICGEISCLKGLQGMRGYAI